MTLVIIPVISRATAETKFLERFANNGSAFDVPLSATGNAPATHYCCCVDLKLTRQFIVDNLPVGTIAVDYDPKLNPAGARAAIAAAGLRKIGGPGPASRG